jgi:transcription initiation factor IIF auxiliary subunit
VLQKIAQVQYLLHPTFPDPLQVRTDPHTNFAVEAFGWGPFNMLITVRYKNGNEEKISYYVDLSKKWPE